MSSVNVSFSRLLRVLVPFIASAGSSQITPAQNFWKWFQGNEGALFDFEKDRDRTFDRLSAEMHKVDPSLTFEFGPKQNGHREFVISADGIRSAFPAVEALFAAAPKLPRWTFIKFRPRRPPYDITYGGVSVHAAAVLARAELHGATADITLFMPGYSDSNSAYTAIAYLLLDQALGEYDVETRVGQVLIKPAEQAPRNASALSALPPSFDRLFVSR